MNDKETAAHTVAAYMTLASIESELEDCYEVRDSGDGYKSLGDVIAVLEKAAQILEG